MSDVPFFDLSAVQASLKTELEDAAKAIIAGGWYILGRRVETFENAFAAYCGAKHAVGVASGLDALILILRAWKEQGRLKEGDGVLVAANTFVASIIAITEAGLKPILVEPDAGTYNLSADGLRSALPQNPKAVIAVHLYGQLCPMQELRDICDETGMLLLEDSAQAHGATLDGRPAGSFGDAAAFSFYPSKNLGALGDGGAIVTNDDALAKLVRALRNYGSERKYYHSQTGLNSRLDEIQAAFLSVKLPHLDEQNARRRVIAKRYRDEIGNAHITLPQVLAEEESHVWHLFVVRTAQREALASHLAASGIQTAVHYPVAPHRQQCYRDLLSDNSLPLTEAIHEEVLSLPMSPVLEDWQVTKVIDAVNSFASAAKSVAA